MIDQGKIREFVLTKLKEEFELVPIKIVDGFSFCYADIGKGDSEIFRIAIIGKLETIDEC